MNVFIWWISQYNSVIILISTELFKIPSLATVQLVLSMHFKPKLWYIFLKRYVTKTVLLNQKNIMYTLYDNPDSITYPFRFFSPFSFITHPTPTISVSTHLAKQAHTSTYPIILPQLWASAYFLLSFHSWSNIMSRTWAF